MSITLKPILACNLHCTGCYEAEVFARNNNRPDPYDLDAIIAAAAKARETRGHPGPGERAEATLHGGEIGLMPAKDLERLCQALYEQGWGLSVQTNGTLWPDDKIAILAKYKAAVGVSINGPAELNRDRRAGNSDAATDRMTERVHDTIGRMAKAGIQVSGIVVVSRTNCGTPEKVERMVEWATGMGEKYGMWWFRWNPVYQDRESVAMMDGGLQELTDAELTAVYRRLLDATLADARRQWMPFREFVDNLCGLGVAPCWMQPCDVGATDAVYNILGDGELGNCQRTSKVGIPYLRVPGPYNHSRQMGLEQIPTEEGGCGGCRYWRVCYGGCPAEAVDGDWRNKSRFCGTYIATYQEIERRMKGLIPNWVPVPDWTTNDERRLLSLRTQHQPDVDAFHSVRPRDTARASTWGSYGR